MTELPKQVVTRIEQLPPEQQDAIAEATQRELEEWDWDTIVAKPSSQRFLEQLASEARQEDASGKICESGDDW